MPVRSLNSPVIKWPDQETVHHAVSKWAKEISQDYPKIIRIGYIGSYARGDWGVGSDVDLVVILKSSKEPFWRRSLELPLPELPVPADLLVYTQEEWQMMGEEESRFYLTVQRDAKWVYERGSG
jgi:predicted nucleotidyltransferase